MTLIQTYIDHFASLKRASGNAWTEATLRKAPHKPLLLLAVLDLVHRGVITTPFIDIALSRVELHELFTLYWRRIMPIERTSSIAYPFSRLQGVFWQLRPRPGRTISQAIIRDTTTVSRLERYASGAILDEGLFLLMRDREGGRMLREALLVSHFSPKAQADLREQSAINRESFDYGRQLEEQAFNPLAASPAPTETVRPAARDQGFRRIIITSYNHRCALCGIRIVTPDGHTIVEAAHIVPWSRSRNDDIRNGMALCRLCHWGFDEGMIGVSDSYKVIVSRSIRIDPNVPGLLLTLSDRTIIPPERREFWPSPDYLAEHRKEWRLR
jgi:putative restriction endonuclease